MLGLSASNSTGTSAALWRTVAIGSTCFALGSFSIARAHGDEPPRPVGIADGANRDQVATVNAQGELSAIDQGTRTRLDALIGNVGQQSYDNAGNLRVAANFPATQNVNVTGGTLPFAPKVADQGACWGLFAFPLFGCGGVGITNLDPGSRGSCAPPNNTSVLNLTGYTFHESGGQLTVNFSNSVTQAHWNVFLENSDATQTFSFPVPFDQCFYTCDNLNCTVSGSVVGF